MTQPTEPNRLTENMVMLVTILGTGMVYLDQTAINVALPAMQTALGADVGGLQWLIDIYILSLAVLLLIGGALGDRYGRVRVFVIGLAIFTAASVACGAATTIELLILARGVQGVGGALLVPGGLAIINALIAPARRGRALGLWGTFTPLLVLLGPLLGGWLVDQASWRMVFFVNVPIGLAAAIVALRFVPENRDPNAAGPLDWPGILALMLGLGGILVGLIEGPHLGFEHPLIVGVLLGGLASLGAFVVIEWRSPAPMLPLHLFRIRAFTAISLLTFVHYIALSGVFFFLTLNLQQVQGYGAFESGLAQLPTSIIITVLARYVGRVTDRVGSRPLLVAGVALSGIAFLMFARLGVESNYWLSFFPAIVVFGLSLGLLVVPLTRVALGSLPDRYSGIASGFSNAVSRMSQMIAVAVFGALMAVSFRQALALRTASLPLEAAARAVLWDEARNLGATAPPPGLSAALTEAVQESIHLAFVDGFRSMMVACALLSLLSVVISLSLLADSPAGAAAPAPITIPE